MKEWLNHLADRLYGRFPWLDAGVRKASRAPKDIYINGILSRMELNGMSLDEAYKSFKQNLGEDGKEHLGPLNAAYRHLKNIEGQGK